MFDFARLSRAAGWAFLAYLCMFPATAIVSGVVWHSFHGEVLIRHTWDLVMFGYLPWGFVAFALVLVTAAAHAAMLWPAKHRAAPSTWQAPPVP